MLRDPSLPSHILGAVRLFPSSAGYLLENVLRIHPAGGELRPTSGQHAQELLTALVDERDLFEIHDANACDISAVVLLPARLELLYPGHGQAAMQNPSLFCGRFAEIDLQHAIFLRACPWEDPS
jgi:hypothetical protein